MRYIDLLQELKEIAKSQPNIGFVGSKDIYELNSLPDIKYSVFYITPNSFKLSEDTIDYSLNLYYIDRWDETDNNIIQSTGIEVLTNIINIFNNKFPNIVINYPLEITPFYQKFKDVTSGVYLKLTITLPSNGICDVEY